MKKCELLPRIWFHKEGVKSEGKKAKETIMELILEA